MNIQEYDSIFDCEKLYEYQFCSARTAKNLSRQMRAEGYIARQNGRWIVSNWTPGGWQRWGVAPLYSGVFEVEEGGEDE